MYALSRIMPILEVRDFSREIRASCARTSLWKGKERERKMHGHFGQMYENALGRLATDLTIAANCRQRRQRRSNTHSHIRKRIRTAAVRISKMALAALARYHIGHLVDLVSSLSLSPSQWFPITPFPWAHTPSHHPSHVFHSRQKRFRLSPMSFPGFVTSRKARDRFDLSREPEKNERGTFVPWARSTWDKSEIRSCISKRRKAKLADALESSWLRNCSLDQFIYYLNSVS